MISIFTSVRRITLLLFVLAVCGGFLFGKISPDQFMAIAGVVIAFYFGQGAPAPVVETPAVLETPIVKV